MASIIMAAADDPRMDQQTLSEMFRFRHKVFYERLQWQVESRQGMEIDSYDKLNPVYMVARSTFGAVAGCWRLLPTTGPYMLKDTFPQLLCGEVAPEDENVWELSRLAVVSHEVGELAQASINNITFMMMRRVVEFADKVGIRSYVTVTSVALERLLKNVGLPIRRFGDGRAERVGKVLSVACRIDVNDELRDFVYMPIPAIEQLEAA